MRIKTITIHLDTTWKQLLPSEHPDGYSDRNEKIWKPAFDESSLKTHLRRQITLTQRSKLLAGRNTLNSWLAILATLLIAILNRELKIHSMFGTVDILKMPRE